MERYDGKTRKDDIRKWLLIAGAAAIVLLIFLGRSLFLSVNKAKADLSILLMDAPDDEAAARLEAALAEEIPDVNGDGQVVISVSEGSMTAGNLSESFGAADMYFAESDYDLFLLPRTSEFTNGTDPTTGKPLIVRVDNFAKYNDAEYFDRLWNCSRSAFLSELGLENYLTGFIDWASIGRGDRATAEAALAAAELLARN